jgi:hypothetical protein
MYTVKNGGLILMSLPIQVHCPKWRAQLHIILRTSAMFRMEGAISYYSPHMCTVQNIEHNFISFSVHVHVQGTKGRGNFISFFPHIQTVQNIGLNFISLSTHAHCTKWNISRSPCTIKNEPFGPS